jgi:hypothetical protein
VSSRVGAATAAIRRRSGRRGRRTCGRHARDSGNARRGAPAGGHRATRRSPSVHGRASSRAARS